MRVLYFTKGGPEYPSSRYRVFQFARGLAQEGIELTTCPLFGPSWMSLTTRVGDGPFKSLGRGALGGVALARRSAQVRDLGRYDLVMLEQELAPALPFEVERRLLRGARRIGVELDDAHHLVPRKAAKLTTWFAAADGVIAGNPVLAAEVLEAGGKPHLVPTAVDVIHYPIAEHVARDRPLRIVWLGLPSNFDQLQRLREPLQKLARRRPMELVVISDGLPALDGVPLRAVPWSAAGEAAELAACDIGIMPLADDPWAAGKCGLKLIQYLAAGLPAVADPVGVNRDIAAGGGVILAADAVAWGAALERLAEPAERAELGGHGRANAAANWSVAGWTAGLAATYRAIANGEAATWPH
jgi:glycosyltransferase involved in cell wall biosynthesis